MKTPSTTPTRNETIKRYAQSTIKVALALAFVIAALNLGGYIQLSSFAKEVLAVINGLTGIWILVSNVQ
jgi:hypothetical protein